MSYIIGQRARVSGTFVDSENQLYDPDTLFFKYITPGGTVVTLEKGLDTALVNQAVGKYYVDIDLTYVGTYNWRWQSEGDKPTVIDGSFHVESSLFDEVDDIILEDGSLIPGANCYLSLAEAEKLVSSRLYVEDWHAATSSSKVASLKWATKLLDRSIRWRGRKISSSQSLTFPRYNLKDLSGDSIDSKSIPAFLKDAVLELALHLLREDISQNNSLDSLSSIKIGSIQVKSKDDQISSKLPSSVIEIISEYGSIKAAKKVSVKLERG